MFRQIFSKSKHGRIKLFKDLMCTALFMGILLMGCQFAPEDGVKTQSTQDASVLVAKLESSPDTSKTADTYKKLLGLQLEYAQKGVETVSEYITIPESTPRYPGKKSANGKYKANGWETCAREL
jgi:hypothetical protein